jgi:hypothetical protein
MYCIRANEILEDFYRPKEIHVEVQAVDIKKHKITKYDWGLDTMASNDLDVLANIKNASPINIKVADGTTYRSSIAGTAKLYMDGDIEDLQINI